MNSREIEFRGKRSDNGEWVYGSLMVFNNNTRAIMPLQDHDTKELLSFYEVDADTVGQFTDLYDKDNKEIYEGDLLRVPAKDKWEETSYILQEVFWHDNDSADGHIGWQMNRAHFMGNLGGGSIWRKFLPKYVKDMVIIGNIHENPNLLTTEE